MISMAVKFAMHFANTRVLVDVAMAEEFRQFFNFLPKSKWNVYAVTLTYRDALDSIRYCAHVESTSKVQR